MRAAIVIALALLVGAVACSGDKTAYDVFVVFTTSATQENLDEATEILRSYDDDLEFLILESLPPIGRASLETGASDFCAKVERELAAKTYVDSVTCQEREELLTTGTPDEPVQGP